MPVLDRPFQYCQGRLLSCRSDIQAPPLAREIRILRISRRRRMSRTFARAWSNRTRCRATAARATVTKAKETVFPAEYRECPKRGNLVLFCPSIGLRSLPGAAPAFLSLTAWLECLRDDV